MIWRKSRLFFPYSVENIQFKIQKKKKTNFIKSACSTFLKGKSLKSFSLMNPSILVVYTYVKWKLQTGLINNTT